jgi:hypothetical protein
MLRRRGLLNYIGKVDCELSDTIAAQCEKFAESAAMTSLRIICPPSGHKEAFHLLLHFLCIFRLVIFMKITRKRRNVWFVYSTVTGEEDDIWERV